MRISFSSGVDGFFFTMVLRSNRFRLLGLDGGLFYRGLKVVSHLRSALDITSAPISTRNEGS